MDGRTDATVAADTWWAGYEVTASVFVVLYLVGLVVDVHGKTVDALVAVDYFVTTRVLIH